MNNASDPSDDLEKTIYQILQDLLDLDEDEFTRTTPLLESGLDSLSLTQLLLSIEEETGIWIDESYLTREHLKNVETLAQCVRELANTSSETSSDGSGEM